MRITCLHWLLILGTGQVITLAVLIWLHIRQARLVRDTLRHHAAGITAAIVELRATCERGSIAGLSGMAGEIASAMVQVRQAQTAIQALASSDPAPGRPDAVTSLVTDPEEIP